MKTNNHFRAISLIAIFAFIFIQFTGVAQSFSIAPSAGICLDQDGIIRKYDPVVGLTALMGIGAPETSMLSLGLDMSGGQRYRYQANIKTMDLKNDSMAWRSTNAPSIMIWGTIDIPRGGGEGEDDKPNPFAGPVVGFGYGMAFPDMSQEPGNVLKIFLQGNYCFKPNGKVRISAFLRPSLNVLYANGIHEAWDVSGGLSFSIFGSSSSSDY